MLIFSYLTLPPIKRSKAKWSKMAVNLYNIFCVISILEGLAWKYYATKIKKFTLFFDFLLIVVRFTTKI